MEVADILKSVFLLKLRPAKSHKLQQLPLEYIVFTSRGLSFAHRVAKRSRVFLVQFLVITFSKCMLVLQANR